MKQTARHASFGATLFKGFLASLILGLVSACGLAMDTDDRLARAQKALDEGDFQAAIIDAKDVLRDEPGNLRGRLLLGRATVEIGDGPAAEKELLRAIELGSPPAAVAAALARAFVLQGKFDEVLSEIPITGYPASEEEASARVSHGNAYLALNQPQRARELYSSALELQQANLDAELGIISSHIAERNYLQASSGIEHVLETNADNPRVWLFSGSFNNRVREFERAESNFEVALELAGKQAKREYQVEAIAGVATSLLNRQKIDESRSHIERLKVEAPQSLQTKLLVARLALLDKDWTVAQQNAQQILQVAPNFRPAKVLLGAAHLNSGSLTQAEIYLADAVATQPDDVAARQMLVETRLQMRKAEEAVQTLAPLIGGRNADPVSLQLAARASLSKEDTQEALGYLRRNVEQNPDNVDLRLQLATILIQAGESDEAQAILDNIGASASEDNFYYRDTLLVLKSIRDQKPAAALDGAKQLVQNHSSRAGAFDLLGVVQIGQGDVVAASSNFERSLALEPGNILPRRYLAEIDEANGNLDSAESRYESILAENPKAEWAMFAMGRIAYRERDFDEAVGKFRRALSEAPENPGYRLNLARAEYQTGNSSRAIRTLEEYMEATLSHTPSAVFLGTLRAKSGDIDGAIEVARRLQERDSKGPAGFALEGEILLGEKDLKAANIAYDKAVSRGPIKGHVLRSYQVKRQLGAPGIERPLLDFLETRPLDSQIRLTLAEYYKSAGNQAKAVTLYEEIVAAEPENALALNNLAWAYYENGNAAAIDLAHRARTAMPANGSIVDTLGWILTETGSAEEGEALLREAVELTKGNATVMYHHAAALHKLGRTDEARALLTKVLTANDRFSSREDAERLLAEL